MSVMDTSTTNPSSTVQKDVEMVDECTTPFHLRCILRSVDFTSFEITPFEPDENSWDSDDHTDLLSTEYDCYNETPDYFSDGAEPEHEDDNEESDGIRGRFFTIISNELDIVLKRRENIVVHPHSHPTIGGAGCDSPESLQSIIGISRAAFATFWTETIQEVANESLCAFAQLRHKAKVVPHDVLNCNTDTIQQDSGYFWFVPELPQGVGAETEKEQVMQIVSDSEHIMNSMNDGCCQATAPIRLTTTFERINPHRRFLLEIGLSSASTARNSTSMDIADTMAGLEIRPD